MLSRLTVRNFAIVDHLEIDWHAGLNVITGETGAGKSILIDAVGALLGDRLGPEVVRSGAQRALIEGIFSLPETPSAELHATLEEFGLEPEDGALIVSREIAGAGGRGAARVNGRAVPISVLQEMGERLVDVHGQSEHMALLRAREQLDYLDRYAGVLAERGEVARLFRELRNTRAAYQELVASERETARLEDMLRHEIAEIEGAGLREDEEEELVALRSRLENVEHLRASTALALEALTGDGEESPGAAALLARAVASSREVARVDAALAAEADELQAALEQVEESARTLRDYLESLEADPEGLSRTMERLFLFGDLKRKYGDSIGDVLSYADDARRRLAEVEHRAKSLVEVQARADALETELQLAAEALSKRRHAAAHQLSDAVQRELNDLRLADSLFQVSIEQIAVESTGVDRVEFLMGTDRRAMARVASGGELARIALGLKTVLTRAETRPTLIFDEIDVGVGGRTGPIVGEKLARVAASGRQVLCVTHMPQVAVYAAAHFVVTRYATDVSVRQIEGDERLDELAAMLAGGVTKAARQSARELLGRAAKMNA